MNKDIMAVQNRDDYANNDNNFSKKIIGKRLKRRYDSKSQMLDFSSHMRKIPSLTRPDKSVQFAQENTILVIDDDKTAR